MGAERSTIALAFSWRLRRIGGLNARAHCGCFECCHDCLKTKHATSGLAPLERCLATSIDRWATGQPAYLVSKQRSAEASSAVAKFNSKLNSFPDLPHRLRRREGRLTNWAMLRTQRTLPRQDLEVEPQRCSCA